MKKLDNNIYAADDGKVIIRKDNGEIIGNAIWVSDNDSIDNYAESDEPKHVLREELGKELEELGKELEDLRAAWNDKDRLAARIDEIGKVVQTIEGDGSMKDPYKGWKVGMDVEQGKWYLTDDGYLWEAVKSGKPSSTTDNEYFDVVGV